MYLDPGFGSMILQLVLAGILGVGVIIRIFWKRIKRIFGKKEEDNLEMDDDLNDGE
jgi:cbb3-type cytochrome oxidase subunit 3